MALGSPKTKKAVIGTFDLRVGPLNKAGLLTADHSVGIIDNVKLDMQMDSVDLLAGFPQKPVDTAITKFVTGLTATLRENSRRNLNVLLGNPLADYDAAASVVSTTIATGTAIAAGATSLTMGSAQTLTAGDIVVIYDVNDPGNVSICRVGASTSTTSLTLDSNTPIVAPTGAANAFAVGATVKMYKAATIPGGAISVPQYFAAQLIRLDRGTGSPVGFNFWKTTISSGINFNASVTEFASFDLQLKALEPAYSEYVSTGTGLLKHLSTIIPANPVFQVFDVSDAA